MTDNQLAQDLKLAGIFMGYTFEPESSINGIKGVLRADARQNVHLDVTQPFHARYHEDWNWQVPLFSKLLKDMAMAKQFHTEMFFYIHLEYFAAIRTNDPAAGFKIIIENLKWLQQQKGSDNP